MREGSHPSPGRLGALPDGIGCRLVALAGGIVCRLEALANGSHSQDPKMLARTSLVGSKHLQVGSSGRLEALSRRHDCQRETKQKASLVGPEDADEEHHL